MPGKPKLYAHRVKILKYVKVSDAWRFANVVKRSGRIVRDHILITGRDEHHPEGSYYLEWYEHGKRHRKAVADFATVAEAARLKAIEVEALKAGVMSRPAQPAVINPNGITPSRPLSGNGPTAVLTTTLRPALSSCHAGSISTTGTVRMLVWITLRPSAVPVSTGTTC